MTKHRTTIQLSEIQTLRLTCASTPECKGAVLLELSDLNYPTPSKKDRLLEQLRKCPACGKLWMTAQHPVDLAAVPGKMPTVQDLGLLVYTSIVELLKRLKDDPKGVGFTVALEVETAHLAAGAEKGD